MGRIRLLDQAVAERIAAGEVVERPASVVKELVENALDAAAREVVIEVAAAGTELIRVSDDGAGIDADDLRLAVQRFATSKIESSDDLLTINSLGFRGEALPSIAAVSKMVITSAPAGALTGRRLRLAGGIVIGEDTVGVPGGTAVEVQDLFFNTPARRKFLKSAAREFSLIVDAINRLALSHPHVAFRLAHSGDEILRYPGGTLEDRLARVLGVEAFKRTLRCEERGGEMAVTGWLGRPELARATRTHQYIFVNHRSVSSRVVAGAIEQAYQQLLPGGQYPLFVVFVELPPQRVDVNIHPRKFEVRFDDDHQVFGSVLKAAKTALREAQLVRPIGDRMLPTSGIPASLGLDVQRVTGTETPPVEITPGGRLPILRLLGQLHATYLLAQGDDGLAIIDQHAAHERVLYERLVRMRAQGLVNSQGLVTPVSVDLTAEEATIMTGCVDTLAKLGFVVEPFGDRTVLIRAVPQVALKASPAQLLRDLLAEAADGEQTRATAILLERLTIATACRTAVKAGDLLSTEQMVALVRDLAGTEDPFTCFHGRPTIVTVPLTHVERWFYRT